MCVCVLIKIKKTKKNCQEFLRFIKGEILKKIIEIWIKVLFFKTPYNYNKKNVLKSKISQKIKQKQTIK